LEIDKKIEALESIEEESIFCTTAMMTYNPSIGRVMQKGGVDKFVNISWEALKNVSQITSLVEFDKWHNQYVREIISQIGQTSKGKTISYGQAQKPINVFLKVYIDWMNKPNLNIAENMRNYLHVPIDSVVMKCIGRYYPSIYQKYNLSKSPLSKINEIRYNKWQECFREISPVKPLLIDGFWSIERFREILKKIAVK
jgi:hypothetical protein